MTGINKNDNKQKVEVDISTETFIRLAVLTIGIILLFLAISKASHALLLIFIAFFLALALNAPVHWLSDKLPGKKRGNRSLGTSLSFLVVILLLSAFLASLVPPLVKQTQSFVDVAPELITDFRSQDSATGRFIRNYNLEDQVDKLASQLSSRADNVGGAAFSTVQKVGSSAFGLLTILVLTFMMLIEGPRWISFFKRLVPGRNQEKVERVTNSMYLVIKGYVNGQVVLAAIAAILIMPMILILDISYPLALMVIVFICGLIPMVGHTIGAIIVTTVALFQSIPAAIIILSYYFLYQQIENYFIQPKVQANSTNMSPLLVFASVVVGVSFGGLFGALVAIPIAGCIRIALLEYMRDRNMISTSEFDTAVTKPETR